MVPVTSTLPCDATAIRETYEEAGCSVSLLPVLLSTRCIPPSSFSSSSSNNNNNNEQLKVARFDLTGDVLLPNTALMQHYQKKNDALAIVLWHVAIGDSRAPLTKETRMLDEKYSALWVSFEEGPGMMVNSTYLALAASKMDRVDVGINLAAMACHDPSPLPSQLSSSKLSEVSGVRKWYPGPRQL
ncbi:hypothetical protein QBC36DRAFT_286112 [Triangularia setosa]|uniref:Nudix hydrolase domain-containing protein n=1 Tax=Triangularia setosa TaxID=2587417 RepID=A0AAN6WIA6_9PEZI|nr:hypothetical protein QBC36DRAFT_286112 [Podospora setosa]